MLLAAAFRRMLPPRIQMWEGALPPMNAKTTTPQMHAVILHAYGDVSQLRYEEDDIPEPGAGEVLVRLHATSINPIDWKIRSGSAKERFPLDLPEILGRDLSGVVDLPGSGVEGFPKGMRVMGMANGTFAEFTVAKADVLAPYSGISQL